MSRSNKNPVNDEILSKEKTFENNTIDRSTFEDDVDLKGTFRVDYTPYDSDRGEDIRELLSSVYVSISEAETLHKKYITTLKEKLIFLTNKDSNKYRINEVDFSSKWSNETIELLTEIESHKNLLHKITRTDRLFNRHEPQNPQHQGPVPSDSVPHWLWCKFFKC